MPSKDPRIFQFPQVCIVEASAGSGKTHALAQRYVQLLINPTLKLQEIPLRNILAMTFSNKAAFEMKERILEFLKKIALDKFTSPKEKESILSFLDVDFAFAQKKAYVLMDNLIKNYNFFQVQTIDSFINAILSGCAFRLNLSANFRIKTDYSDYLSYSLDRLIDRASCEKDVLNMFQKFLLQYIHIENRTGWFPKKDILLLVTDLFSKVNKYGATFKRSRVETKELVAKKKKILQSIRPLQRNLPAETHGTFEKKLADFIEQNRDTFDLDDVSGFFSKEEFPVTKNGKIPARIAKQWKQIRERIQEVAELESRAVFNTYIDIFNQVLDDFKALSSKEDILFLDELNRETRVLFDEKAIGPPELYYRLATRLKHFLIDEFQDTSNLQWQNLYLMVEEALSTGGSLFYVGDKKQAIYRFRGGDVTLFDSVKERFKNFNVIAFSLNQNYRSQKEIVEFTNEIFSQEHLQGFFEQIGEVKKSGFKFAPDEINQILEVFKESRQTHKKDREAGYVKIELVDSKNKDERNEMTKDRLLNLVVGLKNRWNDRDIAVLTRKNDDVELLTEWLIEKGIPVESEKTLNIRNNSYIKEVVSFLKFLNSPIDNLSFVSFMTGDIFSRASGLDKEELRDFIFGLRERTLEEKSFYFYREFRQRFPQVWESFIEEFFKNVGFVPLYELVISIYNKFKCLESFGDYQGFFMRFLELIKEQEDDRYSLSLFLEFFEAAADEDLYVKVSRTDAVIVLTIHKSKGLGFPVVIVPFLEMSADVDPTVSYPEHGHLVLRRINEKYRTFSEKLDEVYRKEYLKSFIDELNSIYVALSRAKEELYVFLPQNAKRGFNPARLLIPTDRLERGKRSQCLSEKSQNEKERATHELSFSQYGDWIRFLKDEFIDSSLLESRKKILRGEVLHHLLSSIGNLKHQNKNLVLKESLEKTRLQFPFMEDLKGCKDILGNLLDDERLKPFFFAEGAEVFQEKEVVDRFGNTKRIDRLIVGKKSVQIIDYKSSKDASDQDRAQVSEYMRIAAEIYPKKEIKGLLIYLDTLELEEVRTM